MSLILNGDSGVQFNDSSLQGAAASPYVLKNRIINGAMQIWQRGTSFSAPSGVYTSDRWLTFQGGTGANIAQVAGPTGYKYAMQITGVAGNTSIQTMQRIESVNCTDLVGQNVTISANISASSSQTFGWQLFYANASDNFVTQTLISSGTWAVTSTPTVFSATITNLPSGAANGLSLLWGPNNLGAFTSGTLTITGVQLEIGTSATPFERRLYNQEFANCQRYYQTQGTDIGNSLIWSGNVTNAVSYYSSKTLQVTMRASPTVTVGSQLGINQFAGAPTVDWASSDGFRFYNTANSTNNGGYYFYKWSATAEL